ncbi:MAG: response regulator [Acidimicrobiales bacterium]|nr:response regulator [Acidimicrobiales bacterium]
MKSGITDVSASAFGKVRAYFDLEENQSAVPTAPKFWGRFIGIGLVLAQFPTLIAPPIGQAKVDVSLVYKISVVVVIVGIGMSLYNWKGWTLRRQLYLLCSLVGVGLCLSGYAYGPISGPLEMQFLPIAIGVYIGVTQPQFTSFLILPIIALDELSPVVTLHVPLSKFLNGAILVMISYLVAAELISWAVKLLRNAEKRALESERLAHEAERAEVRRSHTLKVLFDTSPDMIAMLDENGDILTVSNAAVSILGDSPSSYLNFLDPNLIHPEDLDNLKNTIRGLVSGILDEARVRFRLKRNSLAGEANYITVESTMRPLVDSEGSKTAVVSVSRDISQQVAMETKLQLAMEQAASANKAKSDFLARMSHELRTPLNAVLGFGQLLERDDLNELQRDGVARILGAGRHLLNLINEVLDLAKVESGVFDLSIEPVSVSELIDEVKALMTSMIKQSGLTLTIDQLSNDIFVLADQKRLKQIIINLVSNAVKYNSPDGNITIAVELKTGRARILVSDTGKGIPSVHFDKVFVPFERLGQESSSIEGTGIGLALCQELASGMGGEMGFSSVVGQGSTFFVQLKASSTSPTMGGQAEPANSNESNRNNLKIHPARGAAQYKVLYVEDNPSNLELMGRILSEWNEIELTTASDGEAGWQIIKEMPFDLYMLDLHLPGIGGDELLMRIRESNTLREVPVIIVSASAMALDIDRLIELGDC